MADRSIPTTATCPEPRRVTRNGALLPHPPPCSRGDAHPVTRSEAASVRASLVNGAACMGPQHPVQSPLNPNLTVASRKRRAPLGFLSLVRAKLSYKMATLWDTAGASARRGTSEQMSPFSLYKPPCGGDPPSNGLRRHRWLTARSPRRPRAPSFAGLHAMVPLFPFPPRTRAAMPVPRHMLKPPPSGHH